MIAIAPKFLLADPRFAKRAALLFDQILLWPLDPHLPYDQAVQFHGEMDWLRERGVISYIAPQLPFFNIVLGHTGGGETNVNEMLRENSDFQVDLLAAQGIVRSSWPELLQRPESIVRGASVLLAHSHGLDTVPLTTSPEEFVAGEHAATIVTLGAVPAPSENTPWQDIVDFRSDDDAMRSHRALRQWIRDMTSSQASPREIGERVSIPRQSRGL